MFLRFDVPIIMLIRTLSQLTLYMQKMHGRYAKLTVVMQESANAKNESCYAILTYYLCNSCIPIRRSCGYLIRCRPSIGFTGQANICCESLYLSHTILISLSTYTFVLLTYTLVYRTYPFVLIRSNSDIRLEFWVVPPTVEIWVDPTSGNMVVIR